MKVGFLGLGKLGLPCALAVEKQGHEVFGYDVSETVRGYVADRRIPYQEEGVPELLAASSLEVVGSVAELVHRCDLVFLAIQTPHAPAFEGTEPLPAERRDFEYAYLVNAFRQVAAAAWARPNPLTVAVISTVLPGTVGRHLRPLVHEKLRLAYNPFFIAMGTTVADFLGPEFVLLGTDDDQAAEQVTDFYRTIHDRPVFRCSIETAELTKVAYNTFIGAKVVFANTMMELCHKTGADCDDLIDALSLATERIVSPKYLRGGMGDGGGCHPRDNIAMSWLAERTDLSFDLFESIMQARQEQSTWLAQLVWDWWSLTGLPVVVLGKAYKPETNLTVGSPATLLVNQLRSCGDFEVTHYDPFVDEFPLDFGRAVVFIATRHAEFAELDFVTGSVVLDPFGYIGDQDGVTVVRIGRKS